MTHTLRTGVRDVLIQVTACVDAWSRSTLSEDRESRHCNKPALERLLTCVVTTIQSAQVRSI
jgi:hypothetical protein